MSINIGLLNGTTKIKKLHPFTIYPNTPATEVEFTDTTNEKTYVGHISNVEMTLIETIKSLKLKKTDLEKLTNAINEYGSEQYSNGDFNGTYEG